MSSYHPAALLCRLLRVSKMSMNSDLVEPLYVSADHGMFDGFDSESGEAIFLPTARKLGNNLGTFAGVVSSCVDFILQ